MQLNRCVSSGTHGGMRGRDYLALPTQSWGTFLELYNQNIPYISKCPPALGAHKFHDFAAIPVLVIGDQKPLELRDMVFGNDNQTLTLGDQIMVCEDHRSSLVAIVEPTFRGFKDAWNGKRIENVGKLALKKLFPGNAVDGIPFVHKVGILGVGGDDPVLGFNIADKRTSLQNIAQAVHPGGVEASQINGGEACALIEHGVDFCYIGGIEAAYIHALEVGAVPEHTAHIRDTTGIETGHIDCGHLSAIRKHFDHVANAGGVKAVYIQRGQVFAAVEH